MSTNFHTPIVTGESNSPDTINTRLSTLDAAIASVDDALDAMILDDGTGNAEVIAARTAINYGTAPATLGDVVEIIGNNAFHVDAYGATGDGVTNDYTAIAAAITALSAGSQLVFTPGKTYICNTGLTISDANVTVIGYGATLNTSALNNVALTINAAGVSVLGLKFVGEATTGSIEVPVSKNSLAITSGSDHLRVQDCRFEGYFKGGVRSQGNYVQIRGNTFVGVRHYDSDHYGCIHLSSTVEHAIVTNNTMTEVFDAGISLYNGVKYSTISNNSIYHTVEAGGAGSMGIYANIATVGCTISNNVIRGAIWEGIMLGNGSANSASYGNTITGNTIIDCDYTGITVRAASGTSGNLSQNYDNTITGNTIQNLTVRAASGILLDSASTYDYVTDITITGNTFYATDNAGTSRMANGFRGDATNCSRVVVSGNTFNGVDVAMYAAGDYLTITGNLINNATHGIYLTGANYALVNGNQVLDTATASIQYVSGTNTMVENNFVDRLPTSAQTNWKDNQIHGVLWVGSATLASGTVTITNAAFATTSGQARVMIERSSFVGTAGALYVSAVNQASSQITIKSTSAVDDGNILWRLIR